MAMGNSRTIKRLGNKMSILCATDLSLRAFLIRTKNNKLSQGHLFQGKPSYILLGI